MSRGNEHAAVMEALRESGGRASGAKLLAILGGRDRVAMASAIWRLHGGRVLSRTPVGTEATTGRGGPWVYTFAPRRGRTAQPGPIVDPEVLISLIRGVHPEDLFPLLSLLFRIRESVEVISAASLEGCPPLTRRPGAADIRYLIKEVPTDRLLGLILRIYGARKRIVALTIIRDADFLRLQGRLGMVGGNSGGLGKALVYTISLRRAGRRRGKG